MPHIIFSLKYNVIFKTMFALVWFKILNTNLTTVFLLRNKTFILFYKS